MGYVVILILLYEFLEFGYILGVKMEKNGIEQLTLKNII